MLHIYNKPTLLKLLLFFNVVNSLVPALLISLDFRYFERTAHELEFINSFTLSFITMILLASLLNPTLALSQPDVLSSTNANNIPISNNHQYAQNNNNNTEWSSNLVMGVTACLVAASNFVLYNAGSAAMAHYLEFSFNTVIALVTFWFCMDNRFVAQMEIGQILYGRHQNCIFCRIRGNDLEAQLQSSAGKKWTSGLFGGGDSAAVRVAPTTSSSSSQGSGSPCDVELLADETTPLMNAV